MFVSMKMGIKVNRPADIISSILTSGGKQIAMKRKSKIKEIIQQFNSRFNIIAAGSITDKIFNYKKKTYKTKKIANLVKTKDEIDKNILEKEFKVVDARNKNRFLGLEKEPRPGIKSGSIKDSHCLPFSELINPDNRTFLDKNLIKEKFKQITIDKENNVVFSCGSGITAAVLSLAYSLINDNYLPTVYDGSWAEYGKIN